MTTKEFAQKMNVAVENAKYFSLVGYHVSMSFWNEAAATDLTVFYEDEKDEEFIQSSTNMKVKFCERNGTKWAELS